MTVPRRIAINIGSGYVPGLDAVVAGAVLAANGLGWVIVSGATRNPGSQASGQIHI